jgi:hypothetical protein
MIDTAGLSEWMYIAVITVIVLGIPVAGLSLMVFNLSHDLGAVPPGVTAVRHPMAVPAVVLGVLGLTCLPLGPVAWFFGARAVAVIDSHPLRYTGRDVAVIGRTLGMVGTLLMGVSVAAISLVNVPVG